MRTFILICALFVNVCVYGENSIYLKDNLKDAIPGDFIVTNQNKTYALLHIMDKNESSLTIQEITIPSSRLPRYGFTWKEWIQQGAPRHTSWVIYLIDLPTGYMREYFSVTKNAWYEMPEAENFLSTLLNLRLYPIPDQQRKRVGTPSLFSSVDKRPIWQPKLVFNGQVVSDVRFTAWHTTWPKDSSEMSGRMVEIFVPEENMKYPSYFPYWLQISGFAGKAKVRIVDSGIDLQTPPPPLAWRLHHKSS